MNMKKAAGLMFVAFGSAGLLAACGLEEGACTFDTDCAGAMVCHQTQCVATCTDNTQCLDSEECAPRPGGAEGSVCQLKEADPNNPQCLDHPDCGEGFLCINEVCIPDEGTLPPSIYTVEIRDQSTGDSCSDVTYGYNTPGAKPMYIALLNGEDLLGWGTAVGADLTGDTDYDYAFEVFDGSAPDYDGDCPETVQNFERATPSAGGATTVNTNFTYDNAVALGCGGSLFVAFYDGNTRIALQDGYTLFVGEYGPMCKNDDMTHDPQSRDDFYGVFACTSTAESVIDNDTCTISLATQQTGMNSIDVVLP